MVLHLAEQLDVPLRERNALLLAAGLRAGLRRARARRRRRMAAVREALDLVLAGHEPYPAVVVDRRWNLVAANCGVALLTDGVAPELLRAAGQRAARVSLHPDGLAPRIVNLGEWRGAPARPAAAPGGAHRRPGAGGAARRAGRLPGGRTSRRGARAAPALVVPLRLRHGDGELSFVSTVTTFGTPLDVTVAELVIESFFPADDATAAALRRG